MKPTSSADGQRRLCTQELLLILERSSQLPAALDRLSGELSAPSFPQHLEHQMDRRSINAAQLSELALLSRSFTYQLCSGTRAPSRDIVLRLALVLELNVEETQRLLRCAQRGALYPRVRRDAVLIFCLTQKLSLFDTDELLRSVGEAPLV